MPSFETGVRLLKNILLRREVTLHSLQMKPMRCTKPFLLRQRFMPGRSVFRCSGTQLETS